VSGIQGKLCMLGHSMTELLTMEVIMADFILLDEDFSDLLTDCILLSRFDGNG